MSVGGLGNFPLCSSSHTWLGHGGAWGWLVVKLRLCSYNHVLSPSTYADVDSSRLGPILIGTLLDVLLYGVTVIQVYIYHTSIKRYECFWNRSLRRAERFPRSDSWFIQTFVSVYQNYNIHVDLCRSYQIYVLFLGDTAHTVLAVVYVYHSLINHFGAHFLAVQLICYSSRLVSGDFDSLLSVDLVFATGQYCQY